MNVLTLLSAACLVAFFGIAHAQEKPAENASKPVAAGTVTPGSAGAESAGAAATESEKELEGDLARYWGSRRKVKVVQRRLFTKDSRIETAVYGGIIPNDDFIVYYPVGIRAAYHFTEGLSVELSYAYLFDKQSTLTKFLEDPDGGGLKRADIQEFIHMYEGLNVLWAPIYGKISLLGLKLSHFDAYVGLGFGLFHTEEFPSDNPDGNKVIKPSGNTILGFRWFITDVINIRTEYRQHFFQKFQGGVSIPVELSLGIGITI
jgi:outer membrane beta-barrel protein